MPINLSVPDLTELKPRITVFGVGGAGGNAVGNMISSNLEGVDFVIANTDAQALAGSACERRIQMGVSVTEGLGAGSRPEVGRAAAEESLGEIMDHLVGSHMVFITAGMGGGTGTGAAPVIARAAKDQGILTVGVVTKPFQFEGARRMRIAEAGIEEFQQYADTLLIIPNQNLFRVANENTTFADAFSMADRVLDSGVRGITDLMVMPGLMNLDFADVRAVMNEMGKAMMGTGEADGENRAVEAAEAAISNPLLDDVSMKGAKGVLINITGGMDLRLYELDEAANRIRSEVDPDANIIVGSTFNESLEGIMRVSVVATGIESLEAAVPLSTTSGQAESVAPPKWRTAGLAQGPSSVVAMTEAIKSELGVGSAEALADTQEVAQVPEPAASVAPVMRTAPVQAETPPFQQMPAEPLEQKPMERESAPVVRPATSQLSPEAPRPRSAAVPKRKPGVFERMMKGVKAASQANQSAPVKRRKAPTLSPAQRKAPPVQPRPEESRRSEAIPTGAKEQLFSVSDEEEQLEIPAFLRRQAN